ncbi:CTP synthase [Plasmodiophora brassicae]|uniref:CTP synthase n=1 Tax=Plasmodiophora brassicae TaxID=37360 RepID=A0A3P3Y1B6_PLABS|nr:unnamed protein product [Plasmodiophora brassicae]
MKYVLVSGGVVSGLGKGITASSIGVLLQACKLKVTSIKIDPYLNKDAGTMSPYEHGEVYVLDDGGEADLDLGNYERFLDISLTKDHNITTGKIYDLVISRERRGDYLGKTVQVVPHATDAIQDWIERIAVKGVKNNDSQDTIPDVCIIELGGTVGDIESMVFIEALRQFQYKVGRDNFCHVHVSLVPVVGASGEQKSKPIQHSVRELRAGGLSPDIIVCRSSEALNRSVQQKISLFCMVPSSHVLSVPDVSNLYHVPLALMEQRLPSLILSCLRFNVMPPDDMLQWRTLASKVDNVNQPVTIGIVGKYTGMSDSYLSVIKALTHSAITSDLKLSIVWIDSSDLEASTQASNPNQHESAWNSLRSVDGILIPGGFGNRGVEGKILAARYAREYKVPFLGICLGMQVMVIEFARHVAGLRDATSSEFDEFADHPVVMFMPEISTTHMGGTMRLGSRITRIQPDSLAFQLYMGHTEIAERHRHRYEVNPKYIGKLTDAGLRFSGQDLLAERMEIAELEDHPFYFGTQFHPEFLSRPFAPSPPFIGFVQAASKQFTRVNPAPAPIPAGGASTVDSARPAKHPSMDVTRLAKNRSEFALSAASSKSSEPVEASAVVDQREQL